MPLHGRSVGKYLETSSHATCQGTFGPQSSQLAEPLWADPGKKSEINVRELISISKRKERKKKKAWNEWSNILLKFSPARKEPPPQ